MTEISDSLKLKMLKLILEDLEFSKTFPEKLKEFLEDFTGEELIDC